MSVTKFVAAAVLGTVVEASELGLPLTTWLPEWRGDPRGELTLRQVCRHTSGLTVLPSAEVYAAHSVEEQTLALGLTKDSGRFAYNNAAIQLIAVVVHRVTGRHIDQVAATNLFETLGIRDWRWQTDPVGMPLCMAGLQLRAVDLCRIGALYLTEGAWGDRHILPKRWVEAHLVPADLGICSFRQYAWIRRNERGVDVGPAVGFGHDGDFGQWVTVQPQLGVVAVRQQTDYDERDRAWTEFPSDVARLLGVSGLD